MFFAIKGSFVKPTVEVIHLDLCRRSFHTYSFYNSGAHSGLAGTMRSPEEKRSTLPPLGISISVLLSDWNCSQLINPERALHHWILSVNASLIQAFTY